MKKIGLILCMSLLIFSNNIFGQDQSKDVTITSSGSADTQEKAKQVALRSAIEQAFGTFISARTEILNDEMVSDEITSVASGNIKSYEVLNEAQLPDGRWGVTVKSVVSVDKLTTFVQAKGVEIEIKGGLFALNIKQQLLNEQGEMNVIQEMVGLLHETMQTAFDYEIKSGEPKSVDNSNENWQIPLTVTASANKNITFCKDYIIKTLRGIALPVEEAKNYVNLHKTIYPVILDNKGVSEIFFLRSKKSIIALELLLSQYHFYLRLFKFDDSINNSSSKFGFTGHDLNLYDETRIRTNYPEELNEKEKVEHSFWKNKVKSYEVKSSFADLKKIFNDEFYALEQVRAYELIKKVNFHTPAFFSTTYINFPSPGKVVYSCSWKDNKSLNHIEKMTGYSVTSRGIISAFKHGGFVVFEENGHGLIVAITNLGEMDWNSAKTACEELILNGYSDWRLPTKEELALVYVNCKQVGVGSFAETYWSSSENDAANAFALRFSKGDAGNVDKTRTFSVRAVRAF